tara:strand:- start:320 stop:448 length:129 start_codon:yes stop_codon:yes gene_type:complete
LSLEEQVVAAVKAAVEEVLVVVDYLFQILQLVVFLYLHKLTQ